ncbi:MAG: Holliday junction helicase RuvA, partial [Microvirga sp.]|nr:Holliday junction helicase RuvA [Microvirga sp.]
MNVNDTELAAFIEGLAPRARLMGIDLGTKTIGLALSDVERRIATPLETIRRVKFTPDVEQIKVLVKRYDVGGLVVGLPLNMDGTEGPRSQATRAFVRNLNPLIPLPVIFWDERLSTVAVTRTLLDADA